MSDYRKLTDDEQEIAYDIGTNAAMKAMQSFTTVIDTAPKDIRSNACAVAIALMKHKLSMSILVAETACGDGPSFKRAVEQLELRFDQLQLRKWMEQRAARKGQDNAAD